MNTKPIILTVQAFEDFGQIELVDEELLCQIIQCKLLRIMLVQILLYSCQFHSLPAHRYALWMPGLLHQQCEQSPQLLIDSHISYVIRRRSEVIKVCQD